MKEFLSLSLYFTKRTALPLIVGIVVAILVNSIVAIFAIQHGASSDFTPLRPLLYGTFTILGFLASWIGWCVVLIKARRPTRTLAVLVPVLTVLSFGLDGLLALFRFLPHVTTGGILALMTMHVVVVVCGVVTYMWAGRETAK